MSELRKEFTGQEIRELLNIDIPSIGFRDPHLLMCHILGRDAPPIYDEEIIECRLCRKVFKNEAGFLSHVKAHNKNHFPEMKIEFRKEEIAELEKGLYYMQTQLEIQNRKVQRKIQKIRDAEVILRFKKLQAGVIK